MTPFQPKGEYAEWKSVYEAVKDLRPDEIVTNETLSEALSRPLGKNRSPVYRAIRELEQLNHRTLVTVRGVGYRVARAEEHLGLSLDHSKRARRQMTRGLQRSASADRGKLEPDVARRLEAFEATASRVVQFLGKMAIAVDDHARQLAEVRADAQNTDDRVKALEDALRQRGMLE